MIKAVKSIYQFYYNLILRPKKTFTLYFNEHYNSIPYFQFAIILYCIAYGIDSVDKQLLKLDIYPERKFLQNLNNWYMYWPSALIAGLCFGYIKYLIAGWFYNVRVNWSKGVKNIEKARIVNLYNSNILDFCIVYLSICATLLYKVPIPKNTDFSVFDLLSAGITIIAIGYSIYLNFEGAITCFKCKRTNAALWFIIIPALFYFALIIALGAIFMHFLNQTF